ncbi:sulfurtransferase complex subunit TusD [Pseudoalteromonas mariniglutinosa]|uniref:sulfurtransferase complex subunit TusD n=1 Tax=Pseudoalteromonas mariniglutinosa TaxID=206042 RepID=UPI00384D171E
MAQFVLSLHSAPTDHDCVQRLVKFAHSCLAKQHTIAAVFLYQAGVYHVSNHLELASDELPIKSLWQSLHNENIPLLLCVTAAEKRGIEINETTIFTVAGLAEFAMLASEADKWVQFK